MNIIRILLADDHKILRQGLASLIQSSDINAKIDQVGSGEAAWKYILAHSPDVAILDISMGQLSGLEVASKVKNKRLNTRIIFLTMHNDVKIISRALELGSLGYLLKDEAFDEVLTAIECVLSGNIFLSTIVQSKLDGYKENENKYTLTTREKQIVHYISKGYTNKSMADLLNISIKTVDGHRTRIMNKLNIHKVADIVKYAIYEGLDV